MKAVIVGGRARADYLIGLLCQGDNGVAVVNNDFAYCEYLSSRHNIDVICGNGTKLHVLEEANIDGFDTCIALTDSDADNLAICQLTQHFFDIENQVCIVSDPRNVEVFKRLGVGGVVNGTHLLAQAIEEATREAMRSHPRHARLLFGVSREDDETEVGFIAGATSSFHRIGR